MGTNVEGKMAAALRRLGFDDVFDTDTAADFTIMEEATEFVRAREKRRCAAHDYLLQPGLDEILRARTIPDMIAEPLQLQIAAAACSVR